MSVQIVGARVTERGPQGSRYPQRIAVTVDAINGGVFGRHLFEADTDRDWSSALDIHCAGDDAVLEFRIPDASPVECWRVAARLMVAEMRCVDCGQPLDVDDLDAVAADLCASCYRLAAIANAHADGYHLPERDPECPICRTITKET